MSVYAPALVDADDKRRLAVVHGMERTFPLQRLGWTMSEREDFIPLPHRDEWVAAQKFDGGLPFLCNDDTSYPLVLTGWENPNGLAAGSPPHFVVHGVLPSDAAGLSAAVDVLEAIAEGARAFWGHLTPSDTTLEISHQTRDAVHKPGLPPRGLPALRLPEYHRAPEIPHCLGWVNYWSAAAAQAIGFPDTERDAELLTRARRTASGGWVVRLTEAPLELENPEHLEALKRAYERFPEIGGRATSPARSTP